MEQLQANLNHIASLSGKSLTDLLTEFGVQSIMQLTLEQVVSIASRYDYSLDNLLNYNCAVDKTKLQKIKLIILDVDGVLTDAGMYFMEGGDQMKKYNAKDGMAIMALPSHDIEVGIISSGFKLEMVKARAELLNIRHIYVGREPKLAILNEWCKQLSLSLDEVAIIGDDINDLPVMRAVGFSACPSDAVTTVKTEVDLVLRKAGGKGCVREFVDEYLLAQPLTR